MTAYLAQCATDSRWRCGDLTSEWCCVLDNRFFIPAIVGVSSSISSTVSQGTNPQFTWSLDSALIFSSTSIDIFIFISVSALPNRNIRWPWCWPWRWNWHWDPGIGRYSHVLVRSMTTKTSSSNMKKSERALCGIRIWRNATVWVEWNTLGRVIKRANARDAGNWWIVQTRDLWSEQTRNWWSVQTWNWWNEQTRDEVSKHEIDGETRHEIDEASSHLKQN